jgi:hypothetical protein
MKKKYYTLSLSIVLALALVACNNNTSTSASGDVKVTEEAGEITETMENTKDGEHVIEADGELVSYSNVNVKKSGDSEGDEADFYGENSAIFATNKATLSLSDITLATNGKHANGIFSYGEGTTVNVEDSTIETTGNCSGGLMTTGGGTMNAKNLTIHTTGNSSAAIRSDRGGGTVTVSEGTYTTDGEGSPAIYSTANITVSDATLTSTKSEGVIVEGKNSVTLNNVSLTANNTEHNSDKANNYKAVMIYQSMSGDADEGEASFTMKDGSLTNENGDVFFVNNTSAVINLENVAITNNGEGKLLRAAAAGWGTEGSNGGQVTLNAKNQSLSGDILVDDLSSLNMYLGEGSSYTGAINSEKEGGSVYVELKDGATWKLTGDSYITSLTCNADAIDLNGHTLYVNGKAYKTGTETTGKAVEKKKNASANGDGKPSGDDKKTPPEKPSGDDKKTPPEKPDGDGKGTPPEKPDGDGKGTQPEKTDHDSSKESSDDEGNSSNAM